MAPDGEPSNDERADSTVPDWIDATESRSDPPEREISLRMSVVEYGHRPDRCTVYQPDLPAVPRMSTWLSVDKSIVQSLASRR